MGSPDAAAATARADVDGSRLLQDAIGRADAAVLVIEREQTLRAPGCGAPFVNANARGYYFSEYTNRTPWPRSRRARRR